MAEVRVKAIINGEAIKCGACRALLAKKIEPHGIGEFVGESATEFQRQQEPRFTKVVHSYAVIIEIKCKQKSFGKVPCNALNEVYL